ncbi:hypothetical protein BU17DRAFT_70616 [Hysterangium stoloniferum]|nr:hypothetical protein BU17DRAFT_70616 [Hysterangium stoloniferum]
MAGSFRNIGGKRTGRPMLDNGGSERRLQVFVDAIDRGGKDKRGVELDLSADLGSRERLGGCIGFLSSMGERTAEWAPDDVTKVTSALFGAAFAHTPLRTTSMSVRHGATVLSWTKRVICCLDWP